MSKQTAILLLVLLAAMLALVMWSFFVPGSMDATARPHPEIPTMLQSAGTAASSPTMVLIGSLFGMLTVAIFGLCVWVGLLKGGKENALGRWVLGAFVVYALIFAALFWTYTGFIDNPSDSRFTAAFPETTAWMVYGVWFFPLVFVGLYMGLFKRYLLTQEDTEAFSTIVQRSNESEG